MFDPSSSNSKPIFYMMRLRTPNLHGNKLSTLQNTGYSVLSSRIKVIRQDMSRLQLSAYMTIDRRAWRIRVDD